MNLITEKDFKINEKYNKSTEKINIIKKSKIAKDLLLHIKTKQKTSMINRLLMKGIITQSQHREYLNKIKKEKELSKRNVETYAEVLFETDDCVLSSIFEEGTIKYCINQYGMKEYFEDIVTALERFVMISI